MNKEMKFSILKPVFQTHLYIQHTNRRQTDGVSVERIELRVDIAELIVGGLTVPFKNEGFDGDFAMWKRHNNAV